MTEEPAIDDLGDSGQLNETQVSAGGPAPAQHPSDAIADWLGRYPRLLHATIWTVVIGSIVIGVAMFVSGKLEPEGVGYSGAFLINLIGSASVIVPVPGLAAVCAASAPDVGLNIVALGLVGATGATIGEVTGYLAGYGGQSFIQRSRYYGRVNHLVQRRGAMALFILAALPTPLFDVAGIASGSLGYPMRRFLLWVFLGKIIKFIGIAYSCHQGIDWFTDLLNL